MSDDDVILIEDSPQRKSISCEQIPELWVLDKLIAKKHFSQFGKITGFILRPKRFSCTVEYDSQEAAEAALARGGQFRDIKFSVFWTDEVQSAGPGGRDEGFIDPDVQQELDTMGGGPTAGRSRQSAKQSIESFLKKTERFPTPPVVAPPKSFRMPSRPEVVLDSKVGQARADFESLAKQPALTAEERYRVLEARDKYMRLTADRTTDIRKARSTQGTCRDMCPEKERYMRECKLQVAAYESGESNQQMDHGKAIKQYSRSSADQEAPMPHELRSEQALELTMSYLLHRIVDDCEDDEINLGDWFHFVWDRTRGIRKDITQQELCSAKAVQLVEQCARFHIHCAARLVAEDPSVFDQRINTENMTKCLQSLKYMYTDLGLKGVRCRNEAEFRAYVVLLNLNDGNFLWEIKQLPADILNSKQIRFALEVYFALENNNYIRFFRLVRQTSYMNACILLRYFNQIRTRALQTMLRAYTYRIPATFSLEHLVDLLAFEDEEAAAGFLECYGLSVDLSQGTVLMDPKQYERPELPFQLERAFNLVESKRDCSVGEAISGEPLDDESTLDNHRLEESFDSSGLLRDDVLRNILKQSKTIETVTAALGNDDNDDAKVFKVPSPTSISPKPIFPKPLLTGNPFQPSRFTAKLENHSPAPTAKSIFSQNSPSPTLSGITPLPKSTTEPTLKPSTTFGQNLFGSVAFSQPSRPTPIFGNGDGSSIFGRGPATSLTKPSEKEIEEQQLRRQKREAEIKLLQAQTEENRRKQEAEEERIRKELIARKEAEIRRLKQLEEESRRELEATVDKMSEKVFNEMLEEVCKEDITEIAAECLKRYHLLEKYPKQLLEQLQEELLAEFLAETVREEVLVRNCQENRQMNMMRKYFRLWHRNVHIVMDNRMQIENSPAWLPEKMLPDLAKECFRDHQVLNLANMKRYVGGVPRVIPIPLPNEEQVDVFQIVRESVKLRSKPKSNGLVKNHIYWKVSISIPFKQEEDCSGFYYFINKWLKNVFQRTGAADVGNSFYLEAQESPNARERLVVCMRLLKGISILNESNVADRTALDNSNGLLFFLAPNNVQMSRKRLHSLLRNADSWGPIPLTVIAYNCQFNSDESLEELLGLDLLLEQGKIDDFHLLHHRERHKVPLRHTLLQSLAFLASCCSSDCPLEMQSQTAFIATCLGDELWHRFQISSDQNPKLDEACRDVNFVLNLFNQAIDRTANLVQHNLSVYPDFPAEFKPFVSKRRFDIPLDLEYFPKDWRSLDRQQKLVTFFRKLKLKPIIFDPANCQTVKELQANLLTYIRSCMQKPNEKLARHLLALITQQMLRSLPEPNLSPHAMPTMNWLPLIAILANELLRLRWSEFITELPCEVIYHRWEYDSYTRSLWWLPELKKLPQKRKSLAEQTVDDQHGDGEKETVDEMLATSTVLLPVTKKMKLNISLAKDDLEKILDRGRRCLQRAEEKLTQCREFTAQTKELANALDGKMFEQERAFRANRWDWDANFRQS
ncbi:protein xmas-like [Malaya genurostris]|uniref:protein xmas-like n=1 Tax=Malaya genurostris TaxID=325434 RepID=UPI0026F3C0FD|nr:protein xmas-like [Malaya genurostris]